MKRIQLYTRFVDIIVLFMVLTILSIFIIGSNRIEFLLFAIFLGGFVGVVFLFLIEALSKEK